MKTNTFTLGPSFSYSDIATRIYLKQHERNSKDIEYKTYATDVIFDLAKPSTPSGSIGIIPIKNSIAGEINENIEEIERHKDLIVIKDMFDTPIKHCLGINKNPHEDGQVAIYSHIQGLLQCKAFINQNFPNAKLIECSSTAQAAAIVSHIGNEVNAVAICSPDAAKHYNLHIINQNLTNQHNSTTFVVLEKK
jgi:prephenate dehydratase